MTNDTEGSTSQEHPALPDVPNLSAGKAIAYSVANFGYGAFYALNNFILSLYLKRFTQNNILIGLGGSTHSFEGAIIQPLIGSASDRIRTRWGRRRPFILTAIPISTLFLLLTPACAHLPSSIRLWAMVTCIFLFTVTFNIAQDPYNALMPDITPEIQRGRVTGFSMFIFHAGMVILLVLPPKLVSTEQKFGLCGVIMLLTTLFTCILVREPEHPRETVQAPPPLVSIKAALEGLVTLRQARKALAVAFLSGLGIGAVFPFLTIFVQTITRCSDSVAESMPFILVGITAILVLPWGWVVDMLGPRVVLLIALILITCASCAGLWVTTLSQIRLVMLIAGIGNAAQFASAYPLLYELVPRKEVGFYTGLQSTALSISTPLTSIITGYLVNTGGYRRIFVVCAVFVVASIIALIGVQRKMAVLEVEERTAILAAKESAAA